MPWALLEDRLKKIGFRDLLMKLPPQVLEETLKRWITEELQLATDKGALQAVAFDGKTLCGTLREFSPAVHLLAAVDHQTGCVLSQVAVDQKTNEDKAALDLLKSLVWEGPGDHGRCAVLPAGSV